MGKKAGSRPETASEKQKKEGISKKKLVLNISSKIGAEQHPLDLTALRSSVSNFSAVSGHRAQTGCLRSCMQSKMLTINGGMLSKSLAVKGPREIGGQLKRDVR